jgi:hypothetical protein
MPTADNITITDARLKRALERGVAPVINSTIPPMINKAVSDSKIRTGVVTKFYPYLDKAEVQLDNLDKKVLCRLPHRMVGALIDFYTPLGDTDFCDKLREPCILPRETLYCLVIPLHEEDTDDYLLVNYYLGDEIIGFSPPPPGCMRITSFRSNNEDYIEFGGETLKIQTKTPIETSYGDFEEDVVQKSSYNQDEVYTKEEVEALIDEKIAEALANQGD